MSPPLLKMGREEAVIPILRNKVEKVGTGGTGGGICPPFQKRGENPVGGSLLLKGKGGIKIGSGRGLEVGTL